MTRMRYARAAVVLVGALVIALCFLFPLLVGFALLYFATMPSPTAITREERG